MLKLRHLSRQPENTIERRNEPIKYNNNKNQPTSNEHILFQMQHRHFNERKCAALSPFEFYVFSLFHFALCSKNNLCTSPTNAPSVMKEKCKECKPAKNRQIHTHTHSTPRNAIGKKHIIINRIQCLVRLFQNQNTPHGRVVKKTQNKNKVAYTLREREKKNNKRFSNHSKSLEQLAAEKTTTPTYKLTSKKTLRIFRVCRKEKQKMGQRKRYRTKKKKKKN